MTNHTAQSNRQSTNNTRRGRRTLAAIALGSLCFAACSAGETTSPGDTTPAASEASEASEVSTPDTAAVVTTESVTTTTPAATTPAATTPPTEAPPATDPPPTDPPATDPPAPNPTTVDPPPATDAPLPEFDSFSASNVSACAAPDVSIPTIERMVTLTWEITGADTIYVAIDNVDGPFETDLPATGSLQLTVPCPDGNTYYVVAENAAGRTVMEATR